MFSHQLLQRLSYSLRLLWTLGLQISVQGRQVRPHLNRSIRGWGRKQPKKKAGSRRARDFDWQVAAA